ncbi:MAG: hypothetical protein AAF664_24290, partial [Planctomycetota bacterium]
LDLGASDGLASFFSEFTGSHHYRGALHRPDGNEINCEEVKKLLDCDWLLGVDSYPELDHQSNAPIPAVDAKVMIIDPNGQLYEERIQLGGHPSIIHSRIAKTAMMFFRSHLTKEKS